MKTDETRRKFFELRQKGMTYEEISERLRVSQATLHRWRAAAKAVDAEEALGARAEIAKQYNLTENERFETNCQLYKAAVSAMKATWMGHCGAPRIVRMIVELDKRISRALTSPVETEGAEDAEALSENRKNNTRAAVVAEN